MKRMDRKTELYTYNGVLVSHKKESSPYLCYSVGELQKHYAK